MKRSKRKKKKKKIGKGKEKIENRKKIREKGL